MTTMIEATQFILLLDAHFSHNILLDTRTI